MQKIDLLFADQSRRARWSFLLYPFSQIYRGALILRHKLYQWGIFQIKQGDIPVVCVGSIFVGGSGKTPFVRLLLEHLPQKTWVLTRGYRELDEPLFYLNCVVEKDRLWGVKRCFEQGARLVVMDDGLQHFRLRKDLNVALLTQEQIEKEWAFLPLGSLRDLPKTLHQVDYIVLHEIQNKEAYEKAKCFLSKYEAKRFIGTQTEFLGFFTQLGESVPKMEKAILLSSIARAHRFKELIEAQGVEVLDHTILADHGKILDEELDALIVKADALGASFVITEKDAVKYPLDKRMVQAKIGTRIVYDKENFVHLVDKISDVVAEKREKNVSTAH